MEENTQAINIRSKLPMMAGNIPPSIPMGIPFGSLNKNSLSMEPIPFMKI
ncbi:hypothetical protein TXYLGN1_10800 [Tepidimicrobium xylanilyticum]